MAYCLPGPNSALHTAACAAALLSLAVEARYAAHQLLPTVLKHVASQRFARVLPAPKYILQAYALPNCGYFCSRIAIEVTDGSCDRICGRTWARTVLIVLAQ